MDSNPYYSNYLCLPAKQISQMLRMRHVMDDAVQAGLHLKVEADLRVEAMQNALIQVIRNEAADRQQRFRKEADRQKKRRTSAITSRYSVFPGV